MILTTLTTVLIVLDDSCIGLLRGDLQLRRNVVFAVSKLLILPFVIFLWPDHSGKELIAAWIAGLAISTVTLSIKLLSVTRGQSSRLAFRVVYEKRRLMVGHHILNLSVDAPRLVLPILVVIILGATEGAAYTAAMLVVSFITIIPFHLSTVLFALAPGDEIALQREIRKTMRISLILASVRSTSADIFSVHSRTLRIQLRGCEHGNDNSFGLTVYPSAIKVHYVAISRVRNRMQRAAGFTTVGSCLEVVLAALGGVMYGVTGVALGFLIAMLAEATLFSPVVFGGLNARRNLDQLRLGQVDEVASLQVQGLRKPMPVPELDVPESP